jgi:hypothetical protein
MFGQQPEFGTPVEAVLESGLTPRLSRAELALTLAVQLAVGNGHRYTTNPGEAIQSADRFLAWLKANDNTHEEQDR